MSRDPKVKASSKFAFAELYSYSLVRFLYFFSFSDFDKTKFIAVYHFRASFSDSNLSSKNLC